MYKDQSHCESNSHDDFIDSSLATLKVDYIVINYDVMYEW